jgi:hypothetical protein
MYHMVTTVNWPDGKTSKEIKSTFNNEFGVRHGIKVFMQNSKGASSFVFVVVCDTQTGEAA